MNPQAISKIEAETKAWVERFVIGLQLCPFAKVPAEKGRVRYVVCDSTDRKVAYQTYLKELEFLVNHEQEDLETTLVIYPNLFAEFDDYLDFVDLAEECIESAELEGIAQVASFHPDYCFSDVAPDDVTNFTNRSPYPMVHLLLEDSISSAVEAHPDIDGIPVRNMDLMREMGLEKIRTLLAEIAESAQGIQS